MRAVLFDLGNTLVSYYAAVDFPPILRECLRACISVLEPETPLDENELFQRALALNVERADDAVWPLAERLTVLFGDSDPTIPERLTRAFLEPIFATAIVDPDALSVLAHLRTQGFRTAIVSNTPWGSPASAWRAELFRHGLLDAVDATVFCTDVGYRKPHSAPIERALKLVGVRAADAVFVGDDPRWDVVGAQRAGVKPILLARRPGGPLPDAIPIAATLPEVLREVLRSS
jgi:putative hydrolase of the HAD superfamily